MSSSNLLMKKQCPKCASNGADNSGDNLAVYDDGHSYCFACQYFEQGENMENVVAMNEPKIKNDLILNGEFLELEHRHIHKSTCEKYGYQVGKYSGVIGGKPVSNEEVHIANYYDNFNTPVAQKVRASDKRFTVAGDASKLNLFGQHLFKPSEKLSVTVVEGEIDALSVYQAFGGRYAVVSVPNGAQGAKKALSNALDWLNGFDSVVLAFDQDEAGKAAMEECSTLFDPSKVRICNWALKDPNEMLIKGLDEQIRKCVWNAQEIRPQGIIDLSEITTEDFKDLTVKGFDLPFPELNNAIGGLRQRGFTTLVAREKSGKTTFTKEVSLHLTKTGQCRVGLLYLEGDAKLEGISLAAMDLQTPMWQIESRLNEEEIQEKLLPKLAELGKSGLYLYDHKGAISADQVFNSINYMIKGLGCDVIILDNLSITIAGESGDQNERKMIDTLVFKLVKLIQETGAHILNVVHAVKNRKTKDGEDNERITRADIHGSGAFAKFSNTVIALEREESNVKVKVLANRFKGIDGYMDTLQYNAGTGRLEIVESVIGE